MKKMVGLILTVIAVLSGCAQATGGDEGYDYDRFMKSGAHKDISLVIDTEKPDICLIGDSRVYGFPNELLEGDYDVYNYGCGWTTTYWNADLLKRLADEGKRFDVLIISVGVNDCNAGIPNDLSVSCLRDCLTYAKQIADRVLITTIPGATVAGYVTEKEAEKLTANAVRLNRAIPELTKEAGVELISLHSTLADKTGAYVDSKYDDGTGLHWNAAGYAIIYDLYMSYLGKE
jgi:lysophospholipase L1-like esterase